MEGSKKKDPKSIQSKEFLYFLYEKNIYLQLMGQRNLGSLISKESKQELRILE